MVFTVDNTDQYYVAVLETALYFCTDATKGSTDYLKL